MPPAACEQYHSKLGATVVASASDTSSSFVAASRSYNNPGESGITRYGGRLGSSSRCCAHCGRCTGRDRRSQATCGAFRLPLRGRCLGLDVRTPRGAATGAGWFSVQRPRQDFGDILHLEVVLRLDGLDAVLEHGDAEGACGCHGVGAGGERLLDASIVNALTDLLFH